MYTSPALLAVIRKLLLGLAALSLLVAGSACRKGTNKNSNANGSLPPAAVSDPQQSERESQTLVDQGKELYKNDQDEQAAEIFKQAIARDPNSAEAHLRLGMAYGALERKPEADEMYKKAVELYKKRIQANAKDADAYFNLGEAHSFLHQDEDAARDYRQATRLKPDDEEAFYQLGMTETRLAQYSDALTAFKKALELDPDDARATDGIENAQEGANRIKEGKKHSVEMIKKRQPNQNANGNTNGNTNSGSNSLGRPAPKHLPTKPPAKAKAKTSPVG